ncbi:hypothetical protein GOBAR_AA14862 [Gossypium barbadense]|uniref:Uncharacterized protein n=1 Tax=Gossypium barbadense TaxID=3634 RepID=A0A2P5XR04_GOSBA|nr:hypothetical protein GOBAR_AA14862 [Gossypium barbadense]
MTTAPVRLLYNRLHSCGADRVYVAPMSMSKPLEICKNTRSSTTSDCLKDYDDLRELSLSPRVPWVVKSIYQDAPLCIYVRQSLSQEIVLTLVSRLFKNKEHRSNRSYNLQLGFRRNINSKSSRPREAEVSYSPLSVDLAWSLVGGYGLSMQCLASVRTIKGDLFVRFLQECQFSGIGFYRLVEVEYFCTSYLVHVPGRSGGQPDRRRQDQRERWNWRMAMVGIPDRTSGGSTARCGERGHVSASLAPNVDYAASHLRLSESAFSRSTARYAFDYLARRVFHVVIRVKVAGQSGSGKDLAITLPSLSTGEFERRARHFNLVRVIRERTEGRRHEPVRNVPRREVATGTYTTFGSLSTRARAIPHGSNLSVIVVPLVESSLGRSAEIGIGTEITGHVVLGYTASSIDTFIRHQS